MTQWNLNTTDQKSQPSLDLYNWDILHWTNKNLTLGKLQKEILQWQQRCYHLLLIYLVLVPGAKTNADSEKQSSCIWGNKTNCLANPTDVKDVQMWNKFIKNTDTQPTIWKQTQ